MSQWFNGVNEFMQSCNDVVQTILHPQMIKPNPLDDQPEKQQKAREIIFQTLFTSFSKIFLLHPR